MYPCSNDNKLCLDSVTVTGIKCNEMTFVRSFSVKKGPRLQQAEILPY